ncbi:ABC transporter permease subunit [Vagococcus salmoninarum]|uniref:ABC transporter permease subunit n=1 Tax=Vagococcus salmoninarum TaxID=2739 RepID=UPI00398A98DA
MISWPLIKHELSRTWLLLIVFLLILTMYTTIILSMFDPNLGSVLADLEKAMPEVMAAFNLKGAGTADLIHYISSYLFGYILVIFPLIFSLVLANRLIAKYVSDGSMAYLLSSPNSRWKIIRSQILVAVTALFLLIASIGLVTLIYCHWTFPGQLKGQKFAYLIIGLLGLHLFINGFSFLISCCFNDTKYSYSWSIGLVVWAFLMQMIANQGEKFANLKYLSFLSLFSPDELLNGQALAFWLVGLLYLLAFSSYTLGGFIFAKRNLPL